MKAFPMKTFIVRLALCIVAAAAALHLAAQQPPAQTNLTPSAEQAEAIGLPADAEAILATRGLR